MAANDLLTAPNYSPLRDGTEVKEQTMANLTDTVIRHTIKRVEKSRADEQLTDGEGRGTGRLALFIKAMPARVTATWMAIQWRNGKRTKSTIGTYPTLSLAEARAIFKRDYADVIQKGASIKVASDTRAGTVADLFNGYVGHLKSAEKSSWPDVKQSLDKVGKILGSTRPARDIDPEEVVGVLRPIYERGAPAMADHVRGHIRAAYSWGLKSEHDYRRNTPRRFGLVANPAASIPTEPKTPGTRWLREDEFVRLYRWLEFPDTPVHPPYTRAVRVLMLTGQRVEEIARLHRNQWDAKEGIIDWSKTKNGKAHAIPVPDLAADIIGSIIPNRYGWFFPSAQDPSQPVSAGTLYSFMWRQRDRGVIPVVTNRDLRRTWKTMAGKAGVSKEIRDRLQNHTLQDVSSKSYDRWNYMPEKREGMRKWNTWVTRLLTRKAARTAA